MTRAERKRQNRSLAAKTGKRPRGAANVLTRERNERESVASAAADVTREAALATSAPASDAHAETSKPRTEVTADGKWFPFGRDGNWLEEALWDRNLRMLRSRRDGRRALNALGAVFTPEWSSEPSRMDDVHPVVREQFTIGGRYRLLEVGLMLAAMNEKRRLVARLLAHREYHGTCAELRGGLLLRSAGAAVEWEPVKDGCGPDWLASWPRGTLAVEVKSPRPSDRAEAVHRIETEFFIEFSRKANTPPLRVDAGIWVTLHRNDEIMRLKTPLGFPDMEAVMRLAGETAEAVRRNMPSPLAEGRFPAGRAGDFTVQLGAGEQPMVQFGMQNLPGDEEHDGLRVSETIREAAAQLRALSDVPGLVLLDANADFFLLNHVVGIHETLLTEGWATNLAGVAVVTKTSSADETIGESRIDTIVRVIPGPRVAALENTLLSGLRVCDQRHFHADSLLAPSRSCELVW